MSSAINMLWVAASLTKRIGNTRLSEGDTVRELLSIDGISLWDAVAPALAAFWFPKDLAQKAPARLSVRSVLPYLRLARQLARSVSPPRSGVSGCSNWPQGRACVFLGFSGYMYRDVLAPVKSLLDEGHESDCVVLHDDGVFQKSAVKVAGQGVVSIWEHSYPGYEADEAELYLKFSRAVRKLTIKQLLSALSAEDRAHWPKIEPTFQWLLLGYLKSLIPYVGRARHILTAHPVSVLVSSDQADPRTRVFCLVARSMGIPCLEVQFGLCGKDGVEWQFLAVDKVAVWGSKARQVLLGHGVPESCLEVTGSPRFDEMSTVQDADVQRIRTRLGIPPGKVMALFASQYLLKHYSGFGDFPRIQKSVKRAIFALANKFPEISLVVKPHPIEDVRETLNLASGCGNIIFLLKSDDIREAIKACDVFITLGSTATTDALVAGKLVVYPAFPGLVWWDDVYLKKNVTLVANSETELNTIFGKLISGEYGSFLRELEPARLEFLKDSIHIPDGNAALRIVAFIGKMASKIS